MGYRIITREQLLREAAKFGVEEATLEKGLLGPPVFSEDFRHNLKCYLAFIQEVFCDWAQKDNVIYVGHAIHLLLPGISHVVRIRLIAPSSFRIRTLVEREGMTEGQAAAYIEKVDEQRRAWTLLLYGVDWLSPSLYDLTINLEVMSINSAIEIAAATVNLPEFSVTRQSRKALRDLLLESKVRVALVLAPSTTSAKINVEADSASGAIILRGEAQSPSVVSEVIRIAKEVDGVANVDSRLSASA